MKLVKIASGILQVFSVMGLSLTAINQVSAESIVYTVQDSSQCGWITQWVPTPTINRPLPYEFYVCEEVTITICPYSGGWNTDYDLAMQSGCKAYEEGDYNTALINFRRALNHRSNDPGALAAINHSENKLTANRFGERTQRKYKRDIYNLLRLEQQWFAKRCSTYNMSLSSSYKTELTECGKIAEAIQKIRYNSTLCATAETNICEVASSAWYGSSRSSTQNENRELALQKFSLDIDLELLFEDVLTSGLNQDANTMYQYLEAFLAAGYLQKADRQTWELMEQIGDMDGNYWLGYEEAENLSCLHLSKINSLWRDYSGELDNSGGTQQSKDRFGFSSQIRVIDTVGETPQSIFNSVWKSGDFQALSKFGNSVGWKNKYSELNFTMDAPVGHLPWLVPVTDDSQIMMLHHGLTVHLLSRISQCGL